MLSDKPSAGCMALLQGTACRGRPWGGGEEAVAPSDLIPSSHCCRGKPAGVGLEEEVKWRKWVDDRFVKVLTANIYRSWE